MKAVVLPPEDYVAISRLLRKNRGRVKLVILIVEGDKTVAALARHYNARVLRSGVLLLG